MFQVLSDNLVAKGTIGIFLSGIQISNFVFCHTNPFTHYALRERGRMAEFVNAWLKAILGPRRFRIRGLKS